MALLLRGLLWLSVLGGAAVGIGLPTNNAVQSILNKQQIRDKGGSGTAGRNYEEYGYGKGGFGDIRNKLVSNGNGQSEFETALTGIRKSGGKEKIGKGLELNFKNGLETKKNICKSSGNLNNCYVGTIEFIDNKGETLFGRIPIRDSLGNHNIYIKGQKCKPGSKASSIGKGKKRSQSDTSTSSSGSSSSNSSNYKGCLGESQSK